MNTNIDEINRKIKKQIMIIAAIGIALLIADLAMSSSVGSIKIISSEGQLYMLRPESREEIGHISLNARVTGGKEELEKKVNISLEPYSRKQEETQENKNSDITMTEKERLEYEMRSIANDFNSDRSLKKVKLPDKLETGEKISWEKENTNNSVAISAAVLIIIAIIYKTRFAPIEKKRKANQESVIRQLPEFVNRLVLLLNAGMVLNSAFEKSVEESLVFKTGEEDYFYGRMKDIYTSVKTANGSMYKEFRSFAKESGIKELMRISNIISDNVSKGVELTAKLQTESEILWISRKRSCEERGRLAETKLTLPLVIFLMVLVVITVAPAMLEL